MRTHERNRLIDESNRAMSRMVLWFAVAVITLLVFFIKLLTLNDTQAIALIATISISLLLTTLYLFRYARFNGMMTDDEPPPPPANNVSDTLIFDTEIPQPTVSLHYAEDSLIRIGRYQLTRRQWRTLASTLADLNWRWTRRNVGKAKVIKNLTAPGIYRGMTSDMERLGVVKGGYVTAKGRDVICEAAGLEVVL